MSRLREAKEFGKRLKKSQQEEPKRIFWLICEGNNTEFQYFDGIEKYKKELGLNNLIELKALEREAHDGKSHPKHLFEGAKEAIEEKIISLDEKGNDEIWLICDRDKQNFSEQQYDEFLENCHAENFNIALTNPLFEFWLLLHKENISKLYDEQELLENRKIGSKRRFISKELSKLFQGYNKSNINFNKFLPNVNIAIKQSKQFESNLANLKNSLGTSVGKLLIKLMTRKLDH